MRVTYVASDNSAGDAQTLGAAGQDVFIKKLLVGNPTNGGITNIYNKVVAPGHASGMGSVAVTDVVFQLTQPTAAAGKDWVREIDFTSFGSGGLEVDGGSFHTDENDVTVIWELKDESSV